MKDLKILMLSWKQWKVEDVFSASWVNWMQFNLEEGSEDVVKGLGLVVEVDDEEGEGEGCDHDDYYEYDHD